MTSLAEYKDRQRSATHLLLVGHTKMGKTRYVAEAARAGYTVIYVDADNGLSTLLDVLKNDDAAMNRIMYFNPEDIAVFIENILTKNNFRYNIRTREEYTTAQAKPGDTFIEILPSLIPPQTILAIDSWTSVCQAIMQNQAKRKQVDLLDIDKVSREIYGGSGVKATQIIATLQTVPFHTIVQAHPGYFERKEKPIGKVGNVDEKDMIIKENLEIPQSVSNPHGATLGKYFNQIGWFTIDTSHNRKLDFRVRNGRIGGGTPGGIDDPLGAYSFAKLFGSATGFGAADSNPLWHRSVTKEQFDIEMGRKPTAAPASANNESSPKADETTQEATTVAPKVATPVKNSIIFGKGKTI